jgi:hypothetical protein
MFDSQLTVEVDNYPCCSRNRGHPMNIEDSSTPYRSFVRSGAYPALTQRVMRSGSVLVQAAGWFALVVTAASAGYQMTQRLVPPAAAAPLPARASAAMTASSARAAAPTAHEEAVRAHSSVEREAIVDELSARRLETQASLAPAAAGLGARKRTGAVIQPPPQAATGDPAAVDRAEQVAQRVQALDEAKPAEPAPPEATPDPVEALMRARVEPERAAVPERVVPRAAPAPALPRKESVTLPLRAAAQLDGLNVRGPLSAAHVRRSVDRVRPTLSACYADAAQRAGQNRFAQVRVALTIDEAGRVKTLPKVEGAQLPGLGECLSSAMSKLVCQAPDTGTSHAAIVLGFAPSR